MGRDPFRIDHGFIGGNIQMRVLFVPASVGAQLGLECGSRSFAGIVVDLAESIVIITGPLPSVVTHRGMGRMAAVITLPCIRVQDRALARAIPGDQVSAGAPVRVITHPKALLARLALDAAAAGACEPFCMRLALCQTRQILSSRSSPIGKSIIRL
jgi:hypothetical protein